MAGLTRKELLAGAAAAGVVVGCGGSPQRDDGLRHFDAFVLASHPPRGARGDRAPPARAGRRRRRLPAGAPRWLDDAWRRRRRGYLGVQAPTSRSPTRPRWASASSTAASGRRRRGAPPSTTSTPRTRRCGSASARCRDPPLRRPGAATRRLVGSPSRSARRGPACSRSPGCTRAPACGCPLARDRGRAPGEDTLMVVDGVHGLAAVDEPIDPADVFVAGTHKWLRGPRGTGIVWSRAGPAAPTIPVHAAGARRRSIHPRRLPQLRAPLGARRRVRDPRPPARGSPRWPPGSRRAWPTAEGRG